MTTHHEQARFYTTCIIRLVNKVIVTRGGSVHTSSITQPVMCLLLVCTRVRQCKVYWLNSSTVTQGRCNLGNELFVK